MGETKRINLIVYGLVHGVGFRVFIARTAKELNICGWVRNLPDGSVEIEAQGTDEMLEELLSRAQQGPTLANVTSIHKGEKTPDSNLEGFAITMDVH
jgi:acylphosphatase